MEDHLSDIRSGTTLRNLESLQALIVECAKNIKSNDAVFKISTLPTVSEQLTKLMDSYGEIYHDVEADQNAFLKLAEELSQIEDGDEETTEYIDIEAYKDKFENLRQEELKKIDKAHASAAKKALKSVLNQQNDEEDIQIEQPTRQIPKDPITKRDIVFAVKSNVCSHIYDKDTIEDYFAQKEKAKKKNIQCPMAGCTNKSMKRSEIVDDDETNKLIQSL